MFQRNVLCSVKAWQPVAGSVIKNRIRVAVLGALVGMAATASPVLAQDNRVAMARIGNTENSDFNYRLTWTGTQPFDQTVASFSSRFSYIGLDSNGNSPALTIQFGTGNGNEQKAYTLPTNLTTNKDSDEGAARYEVFRSGGFWDLRAATPIPSAAENAQLAIDYLNKVRQNPAAFSQEIGVNLSGVTARPALVVNRTLSQVAQQKAQDMADRNYFNHTNPDGQGINVLMNQAGYTLPANWIANPADNYFESIQAGLELGPQAVKSLIVDSNDAEKRHRTHLLGMDNWNAPMVDIGVGFAKSPNGQFKTYWCFIIARQQF